MPNKIETGQWLSVLNYSDDQWQDAVFRWN